MPQYPAVIELSELDGENGFQINGEAARDANGTSVAGASDVNGDGYADLIVGATGADPSGIYSGASYVIFGRASGFSAKLDLSTLDGTNGFQLSGEAMNDASGISVAGGGDTNGDGFADLIVGASAADPNAPESGASYVVLGRGSGMPADLQLSTLDGTNGFQVSGASISDFSGGAVAGAGDINGDGLADLIVGADGADPNGASSGTGYVIFGRASAFPAELQVSALDGTNGFQISGETANDMSGRSVASAGDVNGDGLADLIVGANGADPNGAVSGASYVVFGRASGFSATVNLATVDGTNGFQINGEAANDSSGSSVAGAGDVNGDGFADVIVGAPGADPNGSGSGASYVVFGRASGFSATLNLSGLDGTSGFQISGEAAYDRSGRSVGSAGDVNGDGFADLIVGALGAGPNGSSSGASYVVFGRASGFSATLNLSTLDGTNGFQISGEATGDLSGFSVAGAGDVNGDGLADLIVGAPNADPNGRYSGASYVIFGRKPDASVDRTGTVASQSLVGSEFSDRLSGLGGDDRLFGHGGRDALDGGGGDDEAFGGEGRDRLAGRKGDDRLEGGGGADELAGGLGADTLDGGAGDGAADVFRYSDAGASAAEAAGRDLIVGFEVGLDRVDLTRLGVVDFAGQAQVSVVGTGSVVLFDLDGDGAFDDFGLEFEGVVVGAGDFLV